MKVYLIFICAVSCQKIQYSFQSSISNSESSKTYLPPSKLIDGNRRCNMFATLMGEFTPFSKENPNCTEDGKLYKENLIKQELWAVQMYDSSGKYPGGLLSGITYEMGHFDQCLRAQSKNLNLYSAYVLANIRFRLPGDPAKPLSNEGSAWEQLKVQDNPIIPQINNINWALCIPDSCNAQDVQSSIEELLTPAFQSHNISVSVSVNSALYTSKRTSHARRTDGYLVTFYTIVTLVILVNIVGTLYEMNVIQIDRYVNSKNHPVLRTILHSFSIRSSMKSVFQQPKVEHLSAINALKILSATFVIFAHRFYLNLVIPTENPEFINNVLTNFWGNLIKSQVFLETFFIISGFFMHISVTERLNKTKRLNFFFILLYRMSRIWPVYIMALLLHVSIFPYLGNGPFWNAIIQTEVEYCRRNWWTNILFINNYVNTQELCMIPTWSLACDMHFFIIGLFLSYAVWKCEKVGLWIFAIVFSASMYIPAMTIYNKKLRGLSTISASVAMDLRNNPYFVNIYTKSQQRITTYLIGIAAAYVYTKLKHSRVKLSAKSRTLGFVTCVILIIVCHLLTGYFYIPGLEYNPRHHILFYTLHRIVFSLCISYLIVVNAISGFGYITRLYGSHFYSVIAKFSYSIYLTHNMFQMLSLGSVKSPVELSWWTWFWSVQGDFMISLWVSMLIVILFETPCLRMFNKMFAFLEAEYQKPELSNTVSNGKHKIN
ncbi:nose resistant to fluoxetine protein 6-like isoform X2 [Adelges cooleyi]|uniref:nose resistant to fluoxetine protein 6-like isoform X2 n=1 Tax=Adelges cooleyi TaxID=133065 RepID=UPI00217FDCC4|nr:nose resistant to fluoxetine protein 6-like isoform X2 [Adelges cooleyi]